MGLRGVGRHTKTVSVYLVTGICGGPALLSVYYAVAKHIGYNNGMSVPAIIFGVCLVFPIYSYISPDQLKRFGYGIRGDTKDALHDIPPIVTELYRHAKKGLSTKYLNHSESSGETAV